MTGERQRPRQLERTPTAVPGAAAVRAFLKSHPDFLVDNPDLLEVLTPPAQHNGGNVTDLGHFMARRLQEQIARLKLEQRELISTGRANQTAQDQVHRAVMVMLDATSFEHLVHIVTRDLADVLDVDVVTLCAEAHNGSATPGRAPTGGVFVLEPGTIDALVGPGSRARLGSDLPADPAIFGPAAGLVRSQALIRLSASRRAPAGLLAIGSRDDDKFDASHGTELLDFLARVLERLFRAWLDLPS